jgi:predicted nucleic acid-binding protein
MERLKPVLDTNILIDYLGGHVQASDELTLFPRAYISTITWIELMAGCKDRAEQQLIRRFLLGFDRVAVDQEVADLSLLIRRQHRVRLPAASGDGPVDGRLLKQV